MERMEEMGKQTQINDLELLQPIPEEVEAEYQKLADANGISVEEVKKHYADPRSKEYFIDEVKEQKLYNEIFEQVKVTKGDKVKFADLFNNN